MTPEVQWLQSSSSFTIGAGLRVDLKTLGILNSPTNPLPMGHAFRGFPVCFRYDLSVCSPPSADLTGSPQPTETFTSRLSMIGSPVLIAGYDYGSNWTISAGGTFTHKNSS
jgi:hypothetical protein